MEKKREKKSDGGGEKTWIPAVVCVLEQVNSLYSRIAITSTLQQGCSWLELKAVWPDQARGLFFLPFLLKCRYDQLPHCILTASALLLQTTPPTKKKKQKNKIPHNSDNFGKTCPENETGKPTLMLLFQNGLSRTQINQIMLKDKEKNSSNTTNQGKATMHRELLR